MPTIHLPLVWTFAVLFGVLGIGSVSRFLAIRKAPAEERRSRLASLASWWVLLGILAVAAVLGKWGIAAALSVVAVLSLREWVRLLGKNQHGRELVGGVAEWAAIGLALGYYGLLTWQRFALLPFAAPLVFLIVVCALRSLQGRTEDYAKATGGLFWGLMLVAYAPSLSLLTVLESRGTPPAGEVGWFVYIVLLTELNDIFQALVGRRIGRTKITPHVSPNKSLEGLLGGMVCSVICGICLAPTLTTLFQDRSFAAGILVSAVTGVIVSLSGFLGDINVSATKRDAGVKDAGDLVAGQGGMLDRTNSFSFTAPVFYLWLKSMDLL